MRSDKQKNIIVPGALLLASLLAFSAAEAADSPSAGGPWIRDLAPPRRPSTLTIPRQPAALPVPPRRVVAPLKSGGKPEASSAGVVARKAAASPKGLPAAPKAAPASAPREKEASSANADAACGPGQAKKKEVLRKYDRAIAEIEGQLGAVKESAESVQHSLRRLLGDATCFQGKLLGTGSMVYGKVQEGLGPDETGKTAAQRALEIPEKTRKGFTNGEGTFIGLDKLLADLRQAKARYQKMDFCKVDACNGAFQSLHDLDGDLAKSVAEAKRTTAAVQDGIEEADRKITAQKMNELSDAASAYSCPEVTNSAQGALSQWRRLKAAFANLASDMARRTSLLGKKSLALAKVGTSCSAVATNP